MFMDIEQLDPLSAWNWPSEPVAQLIEDSGLINETWAVRVDGQPVAVLQQLNTQIFDPALHYDIEAITVRLEQRGRATPRLLRTRAGHLWHQDALQNTWRCMSWVGDTTWATVPSQAHARSAGHLIGCFYAALFDMEHTFAFERPGAHDTAQHMARLQNVLFTHRNHTLRPKVQAIVEELSELWDFWDGPSDLPLRLCHGDLKISNVRFQGDQAHALIDLDTLHWGTLDAELGDALRSWCNTAPEDAKKPSFDNEIFEAALAGYVGATRGLPLTRLEWRSIVPGLERICIELASRFARDALEESYFGWDPDYGRPGAHNLVRARSMTDLASIVNERSDQLEDILQRLLTSGS